MSYKVHEASYEPGQRELLPEERVVVTTREGPEEAQRVAKHLGLYHRSPRMVITHKDFADGEYLPTFLTKRSLEDPRYGRFRQNYFTPDGSEIFGQGLKGKTVYIVDTLSNSRQSGDLDTRVCRIASAAKYNGAEAVVLLAYTLRYSAQERGVHDTDHPRMQTREAKLRFDGQPLSLFNAMSQYLVSGVDMVINLHNHAPEDTQRITGYLNEMFAPMQQQFKGTNMRFRLNFVNVEMAPIWAAYILTEGEQLLGLDLSDEGRKICFVGPDAGATPLVSLVRKHTGLKNSALAAMDKKRDTFGNVERLTLVNTENMPPTGIDGMFMMLIDDAIRTGATMAKNTEKVYYQSEDVDDLLKGRPAKIVVLATRSNIVPQAETVLASEAIDEIVITNADPRGYKNKADLRDKIQMVYINFTMAEAARCIERGEDPNKILTPQYVIDNGLLKVKISHGHQSKPTNQDGGVILV